MAIAPAEESVAGLRAFRAPSLTDRLAGGRQGREGQGRAKTSRRRESRLARQTEERRRRRSYGPSNLKRHVQTSVP